MAVVFAGPYANLHLAPDNHANTPPLGFLQARCPSYHQTNNVKALKAQGTAWEQSGTSETETACFGAELTEQCMKSVKMVC